MTRMGEIGAEALELVRFMETFKPPHGETVLSYLARVSPLMNDGGPHVSVERSVPVATVHGWSLTVDVYSPVEGFGWPAMVFFHGGAWTMGNPASHDRLAREFAHGGYQVFSVDYPRAPRWRFPHGVDACVIAARWVMENRTRFGAREQGLAVAGDSAGANLAAAVLVALGGGSVADGTADAMAGALLYGIYDYSRALPALGALVASDGQQQSYVDPVLLPSLGSDPRLNPEAAAHHLPPSWFGVGDRDPLRGETLSMFAAASLHQQNSELHVAPGAPHSFLQLPFHPACEAGLASALAFLDARLK